MDVANLEITRARRKLDAPAGNIPNLAVAAPRSDAKVALEGVNGHVAGAAFKPRAPVEALHRHVARARGGG